MQSVDENALAEDLMVGSQKSGVQDPLLSLTRKLTSILVLRNRRQRVLCLTASSEVVFSYEHKIIHHNMQGICSKHWGRGYVRFLNLASKFLTQWSRKIPHQGRQTTHQQDIFEANFFFLSKNFFTIVQNSLLKVPITKTTIF